MWSGTSKVVIQSNSKFFKSFLSVYRPSPDTNRFLEIQKVDDQAFSTEAEIFQILPPEMLALIASWLSPKDIQNLNTTSRLFHTVVSQTIPNHLHEQYTTDFTSTHDFAIDESDSVRSLINLGIYYSCDYTNIFMTYLEML